MPLSSVAFVVRRCCHPPLLPSLSAAVVVHRRQLLLLQLSLPPCVSAVSHRLLLSFPFVVCGPFLHAAVVCHCHCLPLLLSSTAAVFCRHSHHHHSAAVSAVSHQLRSSFPFPIAVRPPIMHVAIVRHRRHPPPSSSAIAVPPLVLPPTRC